MHFFKYVAKKRLLLENFPLKVQRLHIINEKPFESDTNKKSRFTTWKYKKNDVVRESFERDIVKTFKREAS